MEGETKRKPGRPRKTASSKNNTPTSSGRSSPVLALQPGQIPDVPLASVFDPPSLRKPEQMPPPPAPYIPEQGSLDQILTDVNTMYNIEQAKNVSQPNTKWVDPAKVKKDLNEKVASMAERVSLCRLLNGYRKMYWNRFPDYAWVKHYAPDMSWDFLCQTKDEIQTLLNTQSSPSAIAGFIEGIATVIEIASLKMGNPILWGYGRNVRMAVKAGAFNDEVNQLSVEMQDWFYATPKTRVLLKMASIGKDTAEKNINALPKVPAEEPAADVPPRANGL